MNLVGVLDASQQRTVCVRGLDAGRNVNRERPPTAVQGAQAIAHALGLGRDDWQMGYQSRFGREQWLQPYAEPMLWELAAAGVKRIDVACPGFATDCLETLEEVALGFTETLAERGAQMRYIPCLNDAPAHARALAALAVAQPA